MKKYFNIMLILAIVCSILCISGAVVFAQEDPDFGQKGETSLELETYDVTVDFDYYDYNSHFDEYCEKVEIRVTKGTVAEVSSSNEQTAKASFYKPYMKEYQVIVIYAIKPGTATITVTGEEGDVAYINVTVKATLSFTQEEFWFNTYYDDDEFMKYNTEYIYGFPNLEYYPDENEIFPSNDLVAKITSKNTSIVKVIPPTVADDPWSYWEVVPVSVGATALVCEDFGGQKVEIPVKVTAKYMREYIGLYSYVDTARYGDTYLFGCTIPHVAVKLNFAGKSYTAKANKYGDFVFKVPVKKIGTAFKYTIKYKGGSLVLSGKIQKPKTSLASVQKITRQSKKIKVTARNVNKGDIIKVKIGNKTYQYKLKTDKKKVTHKFKIKKSKAGKKITVTVVNKYKQKLTSRSSIVYYAMKVKKNMTKKQCKLVPGWAHPCRVYGWQNWETWWYDKNNDGYEDDSFLQFHKGKLDSWSY